MLKIGKYNELVIDRRVDFGLYLSTGVEEEDVLLPSKYVPKDIKIGDTIKVFIYTDSEDRPIATTLKPKAIVGEFAFLLAKDVSHLGAFMDWGLEKDLLVPSNEQLGNMVKGQKYVVKVCYHEKTDRVYATGRIEKHCDKNIRGLKAGEKVELLIHDFTDIGILAIVNNQYSGMLYRSETFQRLSKGEIIEGYIKKIRDDGKLDLSLKKNNQESQDKAGNIVLEKLTASDGFINCHDKSSPIEIKNHFSMSKSEFKKAIGGLYKAGKIEILDNGIRLKKNS